MAAKKKNKSKALPRSRRHKRGRGRRVALVVAAVLVAAVVGGVFFLLNRGPVELPVPVTIAQAVGVRGAGPGALDSPRGIAVAPDGDLYVADLGNSRVAVFAGGGAFKFNFGVKGPSGGTDKPLEFNEPSGVAVGPDGTVYVADTWNERVQKFDPRGRPLGEYGGPHYSFYSPRTVAVDSAGNLYVGDTGHSQVKIIDPQGRLVKTLGDQGGGSGGFSKEVFGIAVDAKGEIFVADHGNHRIHKFAPLPGCAWIQDRKVPGWEEADPFWPQLALDKQGLLYASDSANAKIWVYDGDLNYRGTLQGGAAFAAPVGLAFSPSMDLWVADMGANRLVKLAPFSIPAPK